MHLRKKDIELRPVNFAEKFEDACQGFVFFFYKSHVTRVFQYQGMGFRGQSEMLFVYGEGDVAIVPACHNKHRDTGLL